MKYINLFLLNNSSELLEEIKEDIKKENACITYNKQKGGSLEMEIEVSKYKISQLTWKLLEKLKKAKAKGEMEVQYEDETEYVYTFEKGQYSVSEKDEE